MLAVIMDRDTPLVVMILEHQRIIDANPRTPFHCFGCTRIKTAFPVIPSALGELRLLPRYRDMLFPQSPTPPLLLLPSVRQLWILPIGPPRILCSLARGLSVPGRLG